MKILFSALVGLLISASAWSADVVTSKIDLTGCLKAITVYSPVYRGKVFPMDEYGWSFIINEKNESTIYRENGEVYKISGFRKTSETCEKITGDDTRGKSGAGGGVHALYQKVMKDTQNNSYDQRRLIADACKDVSSLPSGQGAMMGGVGYMMSGQGSMMTGQGSMTSGQGGMTGFPATKEKSSGGRR